MVDVAEKASTVREAVAECVVRMAPATLRAVRDGTDKGDAILVDRLGAVVKLSIVFRKEPQLVVGRNLRHDAASARLLVVPPRPPAFAKGRQRRGHAQRADDKRESDESGD